MLVSDLDDDAGDVESLTTVMLDYERRGVPLRAVGLNPSSEDVRFVSRLLRRPRDLVAATLPGERTASASAASPVLLILAAVAVATVLAAFLVATERLRWGTAT